MRNILVMMVLITIGVTACDNVRNEESKGQDVLIMPFEGDWQRTFQLGVDSLQYVYYNISDDSIEYIMEGPLPLNYMMAVDTFISEVEIILMFILLSAIAVNALAATPV